jgi:DNA-binding CsgD family transcriptional regulator/PAS domain-containing protein
MTGKHARTACAITSAQTAPSLPFQATLTLHRTRAAGPATPHEIESFGALFSQAELALAISHLLDLQRAETIAAAEVLERNTNGVVTLDRAGRILFANRAALAMAAAADAFMFAPDGMKALRAPDDGALQRLIHAATRPAPGTAARGGALRLKRRSGGRDYAVLVAPLAAPAAASLFAHFMPAATVLITDTNASRAALPNYLDQLYGLTQAELRVADRIVRGDVPKQAAAALGISVKTVRDHLEMLFRKTGTSRQADLLRLLLSLPK